MSPLVLFLPVLCLVTLILRFAMRGLPPPARIAWLSFHSTLLIISGILTSTATVLAVEIVPLPGMVSGNLVQLDRKTNFPELPSAIPLDGLAAKWATQNANLLPVDPRNIAPPLETTGATATLANPAAIAAAAPAEPHRSPLSTQPAEQSAEDPWTQKISIT